MSRRPWFVMGLGVGLGLHQGLKRYGRNPVRRWPWESRARRNARILNDYDWRDRTPPISAVQEGPETELSVGYDMLARRRDAA